MVQTWTDHIFGVSQVLGNISVRERVDVVVAFTQALVLLFLDDFLLRLGIRCMLALQGSALQIFLSVFPVADLVRLPSRRRQRLSFPRNHCSVQVIFVIRRTPAFLLILRICQSILPFRLHVLEAIWIQSSAKILVIIFRLGRLSFFRNR